MTDSIIEMLSLGGGVDSSCLLAMNLCPELAAEHLGITVEKLRESIPEYEWVVFADPGSEWPQTYENLDYAEEICGNAGLKFQRVMHTQGFYRHDETNERIFVTEWRQMEKEEQEQYTHTVEPFTIYEWLTKTGVLPTLPGHNHVCSEKFKGTPQRKWADETFGKEATKVWSLGIEANEKYRSERFTMNKKAGENKLTGHEFRYPLIELDMNREDCIEMLKVLQWDYKGDGSMVEKSSCMWCPYLKGWEIDRLIEANGVGLEEALAIEKKFTETDKHKRWHAAGMPVNKKGGCQGLKGPDGLGYHKRPYVEGDCDHPACAADKKKNQQQGRAQLIQLKFRDKDGKTRRWSIQEYVEHGGAPNKD
jgi:hypothetical protein